MMHSLPGRSADPAVAVEQAVNSSGSSFLAAMRFLSPDKRQAMYALYSFCRAVDDIADEDGTPDGKRRQLAEWRDEIERVYGGTPEAPTARALADAVDRYGLEKADLLALIDGMEMDAAEAVRLPDESALALYCDRVACSVGRLANRIFGVPPEPGDALAKALGDALQMTNILRDLHEDAARNRLYVPLTLLADHGIERTDALAQVLSHPAFARTCDAMAAKARARFAEAKIIIASCERQAVRPAAVMMEVYRAILRGLETRGWQQLDRAVRVPRLLKLWIVFRHGVMG